ncbi:MAG: hypothetical protein AYL28_003140 [Candidatus Bathyarchaeota archaeon B23]|nr:MAG: hypothetical protein AYL28_003140 [Candidatus Bathyarchaeota archaeon B23]
MAEALRLSRGVALYAGVLGVLYLAIGLIEFLSGLISYFGGSSPWWMSPWIPQDIFGGLSAMVIGLLYIASTTSWRRYESIGYLLVATLLSAVFAVLYLLIAGANGLDSLIVGEEWSWMEDISRSEIWLLPPSLPPLIISWRMAMRMKQAAPFSEA